MDLLNFLFDAITPNSIFDYIQSGGIIGLLLAFVIGLYKRWWVMGWQYRAVEASNVRWMELALRSANLVESLNEMQKKQPPVLP